MGILSSKSRRVEPQSVKRGEIVVSRGTRCERKIKRPFKYAVYVGEGRVIEYKNGGNSLGQISMRSLESFYGNAGLRVRAKGILRCENSEAVDRATNQYASPAEEWKHYDYRVRNCETFVNYCTTGKPYGKSVIARRKLVRSLATKIYKYIPWNTIENRTM